MSKNFIETENLCYSYDEDDGRVVPVLKNVSLTIKKGEYLAVLGHNGSGKSTLAKLLNLILTPTSGRIFVDGIDITMRAMREPGCGISRRGSYAFLVFSLYLIYIA